MLVNEGVLWFICIAGGFCLGSIMFGRIIPKVFFNMDICAVSDDHNPGTANVFVKCGVGWGLLCLALDMLKGAFPVWIACNYLPVEKPLFALVMAAPVLGHAVAPFAHFHGGKCIATAFGIVLGLVPVTQVGWLLVVLFIFFSTVVKINPNRIRSMVTFILFGTGSVVWLVMHSQFSVALGCALISIIAAIKHTKKFAVEN